MDESSLPAVAQLLSSSTGSSTRSATCAAIAASASNDKGAAFRRLLGNTPGGETVIRKLLLLCADPENSRLALSALVNISEDEQASNTMIRASAVERATNALLDSEQRRYSSLYAGLLSNLTRFPSGVNALVGKGKGSTAAVAAVNTLLKLVVELEKIPNVLWMANACSTPEGRAALLIRNNDGENANVANGSNHDRQPLTRLLKLLSSTSESTRLAAASALRNCSMAEDCHDILVRRTNAIGVCLSRLVTTTNPLPISKVPHAPHEVKEIIAGLAKPNPEPLVEIRILLVEALLLLCKSSMGRSVLRENDAFFVLEEWEKQEKDEQIREAIDSIMDRIVAAEDVEQEDE